MSLQQTSPSGFDSLLELLLRHKKKIVFCPLAAITLGVLVLIFAPRTYRSEARLFLRVGRESVGMDPTATTGQTLPLQAVGRQDEVKSAIEVFKSRNVIAQAVDKLGPDVVLAGPPTSVQRKPNAMLEAVRQPLRIVAAAVKNLDPISKREEAIVKISRKLGISAERQATVIAIDYDAVSPQLAQLVCQTITDAARQEYIRVHHNDQSRPFLAEQQERLRRRLDESLEALQAAKNEMGLASVEQRRTTLEAQFSAVELDRLSTNQQLATATARIEDLERRLAQVPERHVSSKKHIPNQAADLLRDQLYSLQVRSMDLAARYSDSHPLVQTVKQQLEEAEKLVTEQAEQRTETTDDINPIHRELSLELKREQSLVAGLKSRLAALGEQKAAALADLREVNASDLKIDRLEREAELARSKYFQYARTAEEARMDLELENEKIGNISEAQSATLAEKPVSPNKVIVALATFVLATAGTGALVLASEQLHAARTTPAETESGAAQQAAVAIPRSRVRHRELPVRTNGEH